MDHSEDIDSAPIPENQRRAHSKNYMQWIATIGTLSLMIQVGIQIGWGSPNIQRMRHNNETTTPLHYTFPITLEQISWVASLTGLGGMAGAPIGATCVAYLGSKNTILVTLSLMCVKWFTWVFATSIEWIYLFRILGGVTNSMAFCCHSLYLGEVSLPKIRGTLVSIAAAGFSFGIFFGITLETYVSMQITTPIYLVPCAVTVGLFIWLRSTPYHDVKVGKIDRARASIAAYLPQLQVEEKLAEVQEYVQASTSKVFREKIADLWKPTERKSMLLIVLLYGIPHASGALVVSYYMATIFEDSQSTLLDPSDSVIVVNVLAIVFSALIVRLIDRFGRRALYVASSIGTTVAMIGLGLQFYLVDQKVNAAYLQWLPIICIPLYVMSYNVGYTPVPAAVLSELFPSNVKSVASCIASLSTSLFAFITSKTYQNIINTFGTMYAFWWYGFLSFLATPVALFLLPDTTGKSFLQIQSDLRRNQ
ncbi:hypothetical protein TKK_0006969 [Trichogramma kaykai]|uniref:Major facilitator superfamily (MFS) profile domain-containing protein n=1 Tax=Trichogramma kaykai TaxID=54128 RepID=A0ABD2XB62_9HYME